MVCFYRQFDAAFDKGLITFEESSRIKISKQKKATASVSAGSLQTELWLFLSSKSQLKRVSNRAFAKQLEQPDGIIFLDVLSF